MYLNFYKFNRDPFLLTPDPRFLHFAEPHRKALFALNRAVVEKKGFMVLTGAAGTGKTTLLNLVLYKFSRTPTISSALVVNPLLSRDELLETIIDEFQVACTSTSKPQRLQALHSHFLEVQKKQGTCVLIIDEAHLLSVELLEEIRLLGNMDTFQSKLLQVILCGQPELASVLLDSRLKALCQRITLIAQLRPLTLDETSRYIQERLQLAGHSGPVLFSPAAIAEIRQCTSGVPRLINLLCDSCLYLGCALQVPVIGPELVTKATTRLAMLGPTESSMNTKIEKDTGGVSVIAAGRRSTAGAIHETVRGQD